MGIFVLREVLIFYLRQNEFWFRKWFYIKTYIHLSLFIVFITWIRRWYLNACVPQFKIKNKLWGLYFLSFFKMFSETLALKKPSDQRSVSYSHPCPLYPPLRLVFHFYSQSTPPSLCFSFHIPSVRWLLKVLFSQDMLGVWAAKIQHPARELHVYESRWWSRSFTVIDRLRKLSLGIGFILLSLFLSQILLPGK